MSPVVRRLVGRPLKFRTTSGLRHAAGTGMPTTLPQRLRLCSFNMQAAIGTHSYQNYLTSSWKHVLASSTSLSNLRRIATTLQTYDIVGLQEVDGGSLRSGHVNQLHFIADQAGYPYQYQQRNRNLGRFGQYCNGLLGRYPPFHIESHGLPGPPGRGAIMGIFGDEQDALVVVNVHLALSRGVRRKQLAYLSEQLTNFDRVIMMGDFNCSLEELKQSPLGDVIKAVNLGRSYPSWAPTKSLDHVLVSANVEVLDAEVLTSCQLSDHLPVTLEVAL